MAHSKKAQSALEFLMTYGWAFLIILIMIGALAYFGVLNPDRLLPDKTTFTPPIQVKRGEYIVQAADTDTVVVSLVNSFGSVIKVNGADASTDYANVCGSPSITIEDSNEPTNYENLTDSNAEWRWGEGTQATLRIDCDNGVDLPVDSKVKFSIDLTWFPGGSTSTFSKTANGQIMATVQE